jgi:hypothetical protein
MDRRVRKGGDTQCEGVVRSSGIQTSVPDGDNSDRTNLAHGRESAPWDHHRRSPIGIGACGDPTGG